MEIKIIIPDDKLEELKTGFLKAIPKPEELQHLSDVEWFKRWLKGQIGSAYVTGKKLIARETTNPVIDEECLEVE
jgi:hypothetical protein